MNIDIGSSSVKVVKMMMGTRVTLVNLASWVVMVVMTSVDAVESIDIVLYGVNWFELRLSHLSDGS